MPDQLREFLYCCATVALVCVIAAVVIIGGITVVGMFAIGYWWVGLIVFAIAVPAVVGLIRCVQICWAEGWFFLQ